MTSASSAAKAAAPGPVAAFIRFVACGGGVTLSASGLLVLMTGLMPFLVANAIVTVVSTVVTTELHARVTFRSAERGWRVHLKSAGTVAVGFLVTTAAMTALDALVSDPGVLVEQAVYLTASALIGIARFVVLRVLVFATRKPLDHKPALNKPVLHKPVDPAVLGKAVRGPAVRETAVIAADLPRTAVAVAA